MRTVETPEWLRRRWADIVRAATGEIGRWANAYSHGYIKADDGDFPADGPPAQVPVWSDEETDGTWYDWPHKDLYAEERTVGDTNFPGLTHEQRAERIQQVKDGQWEDARFLGRVYHEFHFGSYAVFRVSLDEDRVMNEGYEQAGTDNERILEDDGHKIVVYML